MKKQLSENFAKRKDLVKVKIGDEILEMKLGELLVNILLMRFFAVFSITPEKDDLFSGKFTQGSLENYFNYILTKFKSKGEDVDYDVIRKIICDTEDELCDNSGIYNHAAGNSVSYRDFIRLDCEDKEAYDLFHPVVKPGPFNEIEAQFSTHSKKLMKYFTNNLNTELHPFAASETGLNSKQLCQCIGFVGLKPDMDGTVIPITITDNFLHGLSGLESYFIACKGARKAATTNSKILFRVSL